MTSSLIDSRSRSTRIHSFCILVAAWAAMLSWSSLVCAADGGRFVDATTTAGVYFNHHPIGTVWPFAGGPAIADYDGDGWDDVYLCNGLGTPNKLYHNNGDGTFTDLADAAGVADTNHESVAALWADFDRDGLIDLYVASQDPTPTARLFRNAGNGTFVDMTAGSGADIGQLYVGGLAAGDYDRDGDLDIAFSAWSGICMLLRNDGAFRFTPVLLPGRNGEPGSFSKGWQPLWADLNHDGWLDLFVPIDYSANRVFISDRDGSFSERAPEMGLENPMNNMGISLGDYDNDGLLDIYITNVEDNPTFAGPGHNVLFKDMGNGVCEEVSQAAGVDRGYFGWGATFVDIDNDGWQDLYEVNGWVYAPYDNKPAILWRNKGDGTFESIGTSVGAAPTCEGRGVAAFDYDRDGKMDLMITTIGGRNYLLHNQLASEGHWLEVELRDSKGFRFGEGAEVVATFKGMKQARLLASGSSFQSQEPLRAHFGLGDSTFVDEVFVRWPGVGLRRLENVAVDQRITVRVGPKGDSNGDGRVDSLDRDSFEGCRSGAGIPHVSYSDCWIFDANSDGDVDDADYHDLFDNPVGGVGPNCCPLAR